MCAAEGPYVGSFFRCWIYGDAAACPAMYGTQPGDFYEFLYDAHGDMEKYGGGKLGRLYFIITHEFEVTFISLFLGPMLHT